MRTPEEFAAGHLAGAVNLDFYAAAFADDLAALDREAPYSSTAEAATARPRPAR